MQILKNRQIKSGVCGKGRKIEADKERERKRGCGDYFSMNHIYQYMYKSTTHTKLHTQNIAYNIRVTFQMGNKTISITEI